MMSTFWYTLPSELETAPPPPNVIKNEEEWFPYNSITKP